MSKEYRYAMEIRPTSYVPIGATPRAPFWSRLWFVVSAVPRYLITGTIKLA